MKSRLVILSMLVLGMLLSTTGAGLAVSGISNGSNAAEAQYGTPTPTPTGTGNVLGEEDQSQGGQDVLPEEDNAPSTSPEQPSRQVEAGAGSPQLPFTGFAAIPILLGGIALLTIGLVLRRRTGDER
jgi:hypothetical protein